MLNGSWGIPRTLTAVFGLMILNLLSGKLTDQAILQDPQLQGGFLPKPEYFNRVEYLNGGYGGFLCATAWVQTVFEYSEALFENKPASNLLSKYKLAVHLDTLWEHPLLVGAWAIPPLKGYSMRDVVPLLEIGARRFPRQWQFRLTWAQYVIDARDIDSTKARDSAAAILLPLASSTSTNVPQYARNLAFTLLHKNGKPEEAMFLLLQTYAQVPDPMVRYQFRGKMGDLLSRNRVSLGRDSSDFLGGVGALLESKDPADRRMAGQLLTDLVDSARRERALDAAHQLAGQYASFSKK